jgi:hypothetical protein
VKIVSDLAAYLLYLILILCGHKSECDATWPNDPKLSHADRRVAPQTR